MTATIFASPLPEFRQNVNARKSSPTKRKRRAGQQTATNNDNDTETDHAGNRKTHQSIDEYTAVLSPDERSQRRLAGQPLSRSPPRHPFPHSRISTLERSDGTIDPISITSRKNGEKEDETAHKSFHAQHISCLTVVLHRTLLNKDFKRAGRALGLILREEVSGHPIDIRAAGNWGIGAEILLRQNAPSSTTASPDDGPSTLDVPKHKNNQRSFTRQGFEDAKAYYEKLIIQYPYHKSWPEATNSIDFYLAMFNLWVYVAHEEGKSNMTEERNITAQSSPDLTPVRHQEVRLQELSQANAIATRMDRCMTTFPYSDNVDLMRLRAMVALWQADLNAECQRFEVDIEDGTLDETIAAFSVDRQPPQNDNGHSSSGHYAANSTAARQTAQGLFARLQNNADWEDE